MKKLLLLLIIFAGLGLAACAPTAATAERALIKNIHEVIGDAPASCSLICTGTNMFEGSLNLVVNENVVAYLQQQTSDNMILQLFESEDLPLLSMLEGQELAFNVQLLYDGRNMKVNQCDLTDECTQKITYYYLNKFLSE